MQQQIVAADPDGGLDGFRLDGERHGLSFNPLRGVKSGGNSSHWCNQAYSDAVNKANLVTDIGERSKLYIAAQKAFYDDVAAVQFADVKAFVPMRKTVSGFKLHFLGGQPFGGVSVGQ